MADSANRSRSRWRRRAALIVTLALTVVGGIALGTGIASATSNCISNSERGLCLAVDAVGVNANVTYKVHVGVDFHMSLAQAQEYMSNPGHPASATIVADDGIDAFCIICIDDFAQPLFEVPITFVSASSERGLSGGFDITVPGSALNEDPPGQEDEIRSFVELWDRDTNRLIKRYMSNQLSGNWS